MDTKELKKLKVKSYLLKHPETELKDITYELPTQSKVIKKMRDKFKISDIKEADITFTKSGKNNFDYTLRIKTKIRDTIWVRPIVLENKRRSYGK